MLDLLRSKKIIVCAGSGGVGKTTVAASLGLMAAEANIKTLVLTIDPSQRLKTVLNLEEGKGRFQKVSDDLELYAGLIESKQIFDQFVIKFSKSKESAERIMQNRLYRQLSTTLSGSEEFSSLMHLLDAFESEEYDLIVLDTPPAAHALDFLKSPEKIYSLFQSSVVKWFDVDKTEKNLITKLIGKGAQVAFSTLKKITGALFIDELYDFFANVKDMSEAISTRSVTIENILKSQQTSFVLVTGFAQAKLFEAESFCKDLSSLGYIIDSVIINRSSPMWYSKKYSDVQSLDFEASEEIQNLALSLIKYYSDRSALYDEFANNFQNVLNVKKVPELMLSLTHLDELQQLHKYLK